LIGVSGSGGTSIPKSLASAIQSDAAFFGSGAECGVYVGTLGAVGAGGGGGTAALGSTPSSEASDFQGSNVSSLIFA
jgi:hypothetical protein